MAWRAFPTVTLPSPPDLHQTLLSFKQQNLFCDMTIHFMPTDTETRTIPAHKVILAASSPFFRDAIKEALEAPESNDCDIWLPTSVEYDAVSTILEWIYVGLREIQASKVFMEKLTVAANVLRLYTLVEFLVDWTVLCDEDALANSNRKDLPSFRQSPVITDVVHAPDSLSDVYVKQEDDIPSFSPDIPSFSPEPMPTEGERRGFDGIGGDGIEGDGIGGDGIAGDGIGGDGIEGDGIGRDGIGGDGIAGDGIRGDLSSQGIGNLEEDFADQRTSKRRGRKRKMDSSRETKNEGKKKRKKKKRGTKTAASTLSPEKEATTEDESKGKNAGKTEKMLVEMRNDPILSLHINDDFVFTCPDINCKTVISKQDTKAIAKNRVFFRHCAKHLWVEHKILCPQIYCRCEEGGCEYVAFDKSSIQAHIRFKHKEEKVPCLICGKVVQENSLKNHIDIIHSGAKENFPCPTCGKTFSRKYFLTLHETAVHNKGEGQRFACDLCDYRTPYKPMLVQHSFLKHQVMVKGAKLLVCDICGVYQTPLLKLLNRHKKRKCIPDSIGERSITCEECGKAFRTQYEVKTHQKRMHEGSDVGMCPNCGEVFRSKSGLKYHLWRVHREGNNGTGPDDKQFRLEKPYRCAYCPHTSGLSGNCRKHVMRSHPGLEVKYLDLRKIQATAPTPLQPLLTPTNPSFLTVQKADDSHASNNLFKETHVFV